MTDTRKIVDSCRKRNQDNQVRGPRDIKSSAQIFSFYKDLYCRWQVFQLIKKQGFEEQIVSIGGSLS